MAMTPLDKLCVRFDTLNEIKELAYATHVGNEFFNELVNLIVATEAKLYEIAPETTYARRDAPAEHVTGRDMVSLLKEGS